MNFYAIGAIYRFEMARFWRTMMQSIASPVLSTSLYFIVFGTAIGSRMMEIDGVSYGAFIVPGLIMLSVLTESISNASFGIYMPKYAGTIYEILSAPISALETVIGYVGAAATKSSCSFAFALSPRSRYTEARSTRCVSRFGSICTACSRYRWASFQLAESNTRPPRKFFAMKRDIPLRRITSAFHMPMTCSAPPWRGLRRTASLPCL